jgi:NitT/TauT family transport system substrate-binding protein
MINTSDSDIATAFIGDTSASAVVTWKPMVSQIAKQKGVVSLFNSSQIPGEILDLTVVRTDVLARPDGAGKKFAMALAGAWYEMLSQMSNDKVLTAIAEGSQDTLASYKEQLSTTKMFYTPKEAAAFGASADLKTRMALFRPRAAGEQHEIGGRGGDPVPGRVGAGEGRSRAAGVRQQLHADGGRGEALRCRRGSC